MSEHTEYQNSTRPPLSREERDKKYAPIIEKYGEALNWLAGNGSPDDMNEASCKK